MRYNTILISAFVATAAALDAVVTTFSDLSCTQPLDTIPVPPNDVIGLDKKFIAWELTGESDLYYQILSSSTGGGPDRAVDPIVDANRQDGCHGTPVEAGWLWGGEILPDPTPRALPDALFD